MADTDELTDDIRRSAKGLLWKLAAHWETTKASGQPFWSGEEVADMFAEALMAERLAERARIADQLSQIAKAEQDPVARAAFVEARFAILKQSQP